MEIAFRYTNSSRVPPYVPSRTEEDVPPSLPAALAQLPNLHTVTTIMPAVWNDALLQVRSIQHNQSISMGRRLTHDPLSAMF